MNFCRQLEPTLFNSSLAFCTTVYGDQKSAKYGGKFAKILGPPVWSWYLFLDMKNIWFAGIFGPLSCTFLIMSAAQEKGSKDRLFWCTGCKFGLLPFINLFPDFTKLSTFDVFGWEGENLDSFSDFLVFMIIWWLSCSGKFFLKCQCTLTYYSQAEKPDARTSFLLGW